MLYDGRNVAGLVVAGAADLVVQKADPLGRADRDEAVEGETPCRRAGRQPAGQPVHGLMVPRQVPGQDRLVVGDAVAQDNLQHLEGGIKRLGQPDVQRIKVQCPGAITAGPGEIAAESIGG